MAYIGRFAPSPTGPLHFGSLVAAVASYCDAKANHGQWLLRIENIDTTREVKGATDQIIQTLEAYGFAWDGDIIYQDKRSALYEHYLMQLIAIDMTYPCTCTRKEIADSANSVGIEGVIYPGTCLHQPIKPNAPQAWRVKTQASKISFNDRLIGKVSHQMQLDIGDFVIKRADGLFAYQLAVVADDAEQNVTHIVRGADLLNSTTRQIYLQQLLKLPAPSYMHIPIVVNAQGEKLSKQTLATPIESKNAKQRIMQALQFLGQSPDLDLSNGSLDDIWTWAFQHWNPTLIPKTNQTAL